MKSINALQRWVRHQASRPALTALAWKMPDPVLLPGLSLLHRFIDSDVKRFGYDHSRALYFLSTKANERMHVAHRQRLKLYPRGFEGRIRRLVESYRLDTFTIGTGSTAVDIGANLGELGFWVLLKIEAEGSEPEVIRGAWNRCLPMTASVALDASPERRGRSPAEECLALSRDAGFSVIDANAAKGRFLLRHPSRGFSG